MSARTLQSLEQRLRATLPMARLEVAELPGCESLRLALISSDFHTGPLEPEVMNAVIANPAYWAFCWGSGLGLAIYLLEHPEIAAGQRVLDLGSGSGVAAIAAARAGAAAVIACDIDADACVATAVNADLNSVNVAVHAALEKVEGPIDLVLMADVLYDRSNLPLLEQAQNIGRQVLVADSRITHLPDPKFRPLGTMDALTYPNLGEFDEFKTVHFFLAG